MVDGLLSSAAEIVERLESWIRRSSHGSSPASPPWVPTFQDNLQRLRRMLPRMQAVLGDAEEREIQGELVQLWLREIKEVAYEADDVLDHCQYEVRRAEVEALPGKELRQVSNSNTRSSMDASFWGKITCRIEEIAHRLDEIWKQQGVVLPLTGGSRKRRYGRTWVPPPSTSILPLSKVYGRDADINSLFKMIFSAGEDNPSVIAVLGMGGVGKTTLVQHVYNDQAVCEHFDLRGWVCVSDDFAVDKLTKRIVEATTKEPCNLNELSVLQEKLVKELSGKRYLLVLDDLWNQDPSLWHSLKAPLRYGSQGSTVIMTTRNEIVAKITQTNTPLKLGCLSFDDCWEIFQQHAFHGQVPYKNQELLEVGKEIVRKCQGLPLASTTLGGLLRYESDISKWHDILRSEMRDVDEISENSILSTLALSYRHLPTNLKRCFAYCSVFPKDVSFTKNQLVRLWMAQGFILVRGDRQLEETAIQYFDELLQRSLFQPSHEYFPEHEDRFVMHDLIHDLAGSVSERECSVIRNGDTWRPSHENYLLRHIAFVSHSYDATVTFQSLCCDGLRGVRSLLLLRISGGWDRKYVVAETLDTMPQKLESLRALDLSYIHLQHLPCSFGNLKHLRYLDLSHTEIEVLSESFCQLYLMQTLDLSYARITHLPDSIKNLKELRYVNLCQTGITMLPETVGELTNLRMLDLGYTSIGDLPQSVGDLKHLTHLDLGGTQITSFPEPVCMLCNLRALNLNNVAVDKLPDSIGNLQNLRHLNLGETRITYLPAALCKLSQLQILNLSFSSIKWLPESMGDLGQLCHLDLSGTNVRCLPESIRKIHNLKSLSLKDSPMRWLLDGESY